ncbi:MAG: hypothetical protein JWQ78_1841 [Sediminibacterium sp.]|nr:hypothetical protein [Sediminibacterium sp.]
MRGIWGNFEILELGNWEISFVAGPLTNYFLDLLDLLDFSLTSLTSLTFLPFLTSLTHPFLTFTHAPPRIR